TRFPRAASHAPSAASEPAPSPSALTCVVSTMSLAESNAARTSASAARRESGTAIMSDTSEHPGPGPRSARVAGRGAARQGTQRLWNLAYVDATCTAKEE